MILECDLGNSRCKWRVVGDETIAGSLDYQRDGFIGFQTVKGITKVRACSVAADEVVQQFVKAVSAYFDCEPMMASSSSHCAGVRNGYVQPEQLGVDRWSALVAAFKQQQAAVVVIDAGSALTVDVVDEDGLHRGGYIAPGLRLMQGALKVDTALVRFDQASTDLALGKTTEEAVGAGVMAALVGSVNQAIEQASMILAKDFSVMITGGDASLIVPLLDRQVLVNQSLVLDGLQWLLPD
jgi:type III pantothenate kinase